MKLIWTEEAETLAFGKGLSSILEAPLVVYLKGNLGAGKTTLVRGFLHGKGMTSAVKSPTFTLVEEYALKSERVCHFDFYRILHPQELKEIGIEDYFTEHTLSFIEWADNAIPFIPPADIVFEFLILPKGREITVQFLTDRGIFYQEALSKGGHFA